MKKRNKTKKTSKEIQAELKHYSLPSRNTEYAVEQCKKQVQEEGKLCYCKEKCHCRIPTQDAVWKLCKKRVWDAL